MTELKSRRSRDMVLRLPARRRRGGSADSTKLATAIAQMVRLTGAPLRTPMKYRRPAADDGTLNLALLVAALVVLVVLRWLALKGGYAV